MKNDFTFKIYKYGLDINIYGIFRIIGGLIFDIKHSPGPYIFISIGIFPFQTTWNITLTLPAKTRERLIAREKLRQIKKKK